MPEFSSPYWLLAGALLPLLGWVGWRRPRPALRFPALDLFAPRAARADWPRLGSLALRLLGLASLLLALAGPRWPDPGERLLVPGTSLVVVLDVSGSMAELDMRADGKPISRLAAAKIALRDFLQGGTVEGVSLPGRAGDEIGLVAFALHPEETCPLTQSLDVVLRLLDAEQPRALPDTGTNLGDALAWALRVLESAATSRRAIVLLSDGEHNQPAPALAPRQAAQLAAHAGVPIYAIDVAPPASSSLAPEERAARAIGRATLEQVAQLSGGRAFAAPDVPAMGQALADIDRRERQPIASSQFRRHREAAHAFSLLAFALIALALALESTVGKRLP